MKYQNEFNPLNYPTCLSKPRRLVSPDAWIEHIPFAMFIIDILRPRVFVELGTHSGVSYCSFCQAVKELSIETKCFSVDTWEGDAQAGYYGPEVLADLRSHHDSLYGGFSQLIQTSFDEAVNLFENGSIDLLHIDGLHTYEAVKHDFETWLSKLSDRAVVLFHDTNEYAADFGVWRLWSELGLKYPSFEFHHGHGLGVLAVGKRFPKALDFLFKSNNDTAVITKFFYELGSRLQVEWLNQNLRGQEAEREQEVKNLNTQVAEREQSIQVLTTQVAEREQSVQALTAQMVEHSQTIQLLTAEEAEREKTIQTLTSQMAEGVLTIQNQTVQVAERDWELMQIKSSKAYRMAMIVRKARHTLLKPKLNNDNKSDYTKQKQDRQLTTNQYSSYGKFLASLDSDLPASLVVGSGTFIYINGWCFHPKKKIKSLFISYDGNLFKIKNHSFAREDVLTNELLNHVEKKNILHSGFWCFLPVYPIRETKEISLKLVAMLYGGEEQTQLLGKIKLIPQPICEKVALDKLHINKPILVAICMATYNPPIELFRKQIQSIQNQSIQNWVCIISDDHSHKEIYDQIVELTKDDERFVVFPNDNRVGHYYNFERSLHFVPDEVEFVAFCDQDDEWYPEKLSKSLEAFHTDNDMLVYCDMDIVDQNKKKVANTFWTNRKNNYKSLEVLIFANTVTGAASLFRASLLKEILPFPEKLGDVYHDHWVACVALSKGDIQYVAESLYAYNQHLNNAYGIQSKNPSYSLFPELKQYFRQLNNYSVLKHEVKASLENLNASYNTYLLRLILITKTLLLRVKPIQWQKRNSLRQISSAENTSIGLSIQSLKYGLTRRPSLGYEFFALRSYYGHHLYSLISGLYKKQIINKIRESERQKLNQISMSPDTNKISQPEYSEDATTRLIKQMIAPLKLTPNDNEPARVNIIMATVDFKYIFGGYMAMFTLAKKIALEGHRVRIVIVESCDYKPDDWRRQILAYPGLEDLFDLVETSYHFDRSIPLQVNPEDRFIATSCWTAHIASQASADINRKKFIFFAQEYEPIFFPMSSIHALSNQSYSLPQFTIFSTDLLRQFFRNHKIGVFASNAEVGNSNSIVINNAINSFNVSMEDLAQRKKKKFLFYARPEAHAARNLYELGILGLSNAIRAGSFDDDWEFYGIGTIGNNRKVVLTDNHTLTLLPKVSLKDYLDLIPHYDLGMSLMLSPHPSLVPLEMAAAGMIAITNTYENKTKQELEKISANLIGVEPTIEGITSGLLAGIKRISNYSERIENSKVNWPTKWDQVFDQNFINKLDEFLDNC